MDITDKENNPYIQSQILNPAKIILITHNVIFIKFAEAYFNNF